MYTNYDNKPAGYAGQVARADQSTSKAWAMPNLSDSDMQSGIFVADVADEFGVKLISSELDVVAGVTVNSGGFKRVKPNEQANIMHISVGDSVWVAVADGDELKRGDAVKIKATGENAGKIATDGEIATGYAVVRVSHNVAEITRKEVLV